MINGDIFMGSFGADQVMDNHFGYRTPVKRSTWPARPAIRGRDLRRRGYISAGIIARDLGLKLWWKPWDAAEALAGGAGGRGRVGPYDGDTNPAERRAPHRSDRCQRHPPNWRAGPGFTPGPCSSQ